MITMTLMLAALASNPAPIGRAAPTDAAPPAARAKPPTQYCVDQTATGTRIPRRTCMTRKDWLSRGWDPLDPEK